MKRWLAVLILSLGTRCFAQVAALPLQQCVNNATQASLSGIQSTNYLVGDIPSCTVTIYLTGTTTLATYYFTPIGAPQTGPFTASPTGQWLAYVSPNQGYDVVLSGGVTPNTYTLPVTFTDISPGGGGSGLTGVTSLNTLTGALTIACGTGLTCTTGGSTITISITPTTAFSINSFTGCGGTLELGQTVTNPTCTATYTGTPTSATITNTDSVNSPLVLITPYTTGTIIGNFLHTATATTTVTLTAIGASTQMANQTYTWKARIFGGVGALGATSTVTASGTTAVLSTSDILPSVGLGAETIGQTFGPYYPTGQAIYLLLTGGSHTFTDACTGFPFAMNAPIAVTFSNEFSVSLPMYLYQSTNPLTAGPGSCGFSPKIAS